MKYKIPEGVFSTTKFISVNFNEFGGWGPNQYKKARSILESLGCGEVKDIKDNKKNYWICNSS